MSGAAALAAVETAVSHGLAMLLFAFGATASETGIIDTAGRRRRSAATYPRQPLGAAVQRPARRSSLQWAITGCPRCKKHRNLACTPPI
jgi:hypothetical protein